MIANLPTSGDITPQLLWNIYERYRYNYGIIVGKNRNERTVNRPTCWYIDADLFRRILASPNLKGVVCTRNNHFCIYNVRVIETYGPPNHLEIV